jgi:hypothetical protein
MSKIILLVIITFLAVVAFVMFRPDSYLPHEKITIRVPYEFSDVPDSMIPMGETINHPKPQVPNGHPGIDLQYNSSKLHSVVASADGTVISIKKGASNPGKWDVEVRNGFYILRYKEMEDYNPAFHYGYRVKEGDFVGHYGISRESDGNTHEQIHWEFASVSLLRDRFCPLTYFDAESFKSINELWAKVPPDANQNMKAQFPYICSGDYKDKTD